MVTVLTTNDNGQLKVSCGRVPLRTFSFWRVQILDQARADLWAEWWRFDVQAGTA